MGARISMEEEARAVSPDNTTINNSSSLLTSTAAQDLNCVKPETETAEVSEENEASQGFQSETIIRREENLKKLEVFKQELAAKREIRRKAIDLCTNKQKQLEDKLAAEQCARIEAESTIARLKQFTDEQVHRDLDQERKKVRKLEEELDHERKIRSKLEQEREDFEEMEQQVHSLKEVASIGKEMLRIRELQVNELKKKLCETQYPEDLREEYETQIDNVKKLKSLYEEKAETIRSEHRKEIQREISRIKLLESKVVELERERKDAESMRERLKSRILKLDRELEERNDAAVVLQEQLDASVVECKDLAFQMSSINDVFTQMLVGYKGTNSTTDLMKTNQNAINDTSAEDIKKSDRVEPTDEDNDKMDSVDFQQDVVAENLGKIWEILIHLSTREDTDLASSESCYKSVETPSGKRSVISVSQTFLTLKNLILEKNTLVKEVNKLKVLNCHLETRLGNQENRLTTVSTELKKTWGVVNKLRTQHRQLHTQEKILKYELQHKRALLNDLKDELEHCKEIWETARQKNCQSEEEWKKLRKEFAERREGRQIRNSAESGYEDDDSNSPSTERSIDEEHDLIRLTDDKKSIKTIATPDIRKPVEVEISTFTSNEFSNTEKCNQIVTSVASANKTQNELQLKENSSLLDPSQNNYNTNMELKEKNPDSEKNNDFNDTFIKASTSLNDDTSAKNVSKFLEGLIMTNSNETGKPEAEDQHIEKELSQYEDKCDKVQKTEMCHHEDISSSEYQRKYSIGNEYNLNKSAICTLENPHESRLQLSKDNLENSTSNGPDVECVSTCEKEKLHDNTNALIGTNVRMSGQSDDEPSQDSESLCADCRTTAQVLDARTERLKRLEEQCRSLFNKVTATTIKSNVLSSKLELLHEQYGRSNDEDDRLVQSDSTTKLDEESKQCDNHNDTNSDA